MLHICVVRSAFISFLFPPLTDKVRQTNVSWFWGLFINELSEFPNVSFDVDCILEITFILLAVFVTELQLCVSAWTFPSYIGQRHSRAGTRLA